MNWLQDLVSSNIISAEQLSSVENAVQNGATYEAALLKIGVSKEVVRAALSTYYSVPAIELSDKELPALDILSYVPEESARHYRVLPINADDELLLIAASNPDDLQMRQAMHFISAKHNLPHKFIFALDVDIEKALQVYDSLSGEVDEALGSLDAQLEKEIANKKKQEKDSDKNDITHLKEDAPVTKIVATILRFAVDGGASDIHIEPTPSKVIVRFRVDGILQKSLELPSDVQAAVVARVKILSSMRLDEKRKPQDGRFSANFDKRRIDFRVSLLPTNHGEKVVMRILDTDSGVRILSDTGISEYHLAAIQRVVKEPYGIILISGPTGSGKSTTLYAMLSEVDRLSKNVLSLEDPVEYDIDNVSQSQVRPEIGYTFAAGLRSALRQDPDIIMVGEIRDKETAQLAIQAALTGHLVLSTIHTNNSIGVVPRLMDMGVDPYLIAPTLKLAIAQRLSRRLYPNTGKEMAVDGPMQKMMEQEFATLPSRYRERIPEFNSVMYPVSSPGSASGTKGRAAVMEVFEVNDKIQELILHGGSEEDMYLEARKNGFMSMKEDAIIKALNHVIPYEEISTFGTTILDEPVESIKGPAMPMSPQKQTEDALQAQQVLVEVEGEFNKTVDNS